MKYILALILALTITPAFAGTVEKTGDYTVKITTTETKTIDNEECCVTRAKCYTLKKIDARISSAEAALASYEAELVKVNAAIDEQEAIISEWEDYKSQAEALGVAEADEEQEAALNIEENSCLVSNKE